MKRTLWFLTPLSVLMWIPVFLIGVFSLQQDGVSKQVVLSASNPVPVVTTILELTTNTVRVFDIESGAVIYSNNDTLVMPMASVAKIFAGAALVSEANLQATTTINWSDVAAEGEAGKLRYNDEYTYQELLFPLLLESSNDAAATLDRATVGTMLAHMNALSKEVGATSTVFTDPSGLGDDTVSTVHDLQLLLTHIYEEQPHIFDITLLPKYIGFNSGWVNNNPFVHEDGYRGGKHGFTNEAGRTAVAIFNEEVLGETMTIGYIILGSKNLKEDMAKLRASVKDSATEN